VGESPSGSRQGWVTLFVLRREENYGALELGFAGFLGVFRFPVEDHVGADTPPDPDAPPPVATETRNIPGTASRTYAATRTRADSTTEPGRWKAMPAFG